jgi:hypothetical protein
VFSIGKKNTQDASLLRRRLASAEITRKSRGYLGVHGNAAVTEVRCFVRWIRIVPDLVAGAGVGRPNIVGNCEVQNTVDHERRRFDGCRLIGLKSPGKSKVLDVLRGNLRERSMTTAGVVAVISGPSVGRGCRRVCSVTSWARPFNGTIAARVMSARMIAASTALLTSKLILVAINENTPRAKANLIVGRRQDG